jgi:hypothetical protein
MAARWRRASGIALLTVQTVVAGDFGWARGPQASAVFFGSSSVGGLHVHSPCPANLESRGPLRLARNATLLVSVARSSPPTVLRQPSRLHTCLESLPSLRLPFSRHPLSLPNRRLKVPGIRLLPPRHPASLKTARRPTVHPKSRRRQPVRKRNGQPRWIPALKHRAHPTKRNASLS